MKPVPTVAACLSLYRNCTRFFGVPDDDIARESPQAFPSLRSCTWERPCLGSCTALFPPYSCTPKSGARSTTRLRWFNFANKPLSPRDTAPAVSRIYRRSRVALLAESPQERQEMRYTGDRCNEGSHPVLSPKGTAHLSPG